MKIKINELVTDGLQTRAALNSDAVSEYAEAMKESHPFPPIVVFTPDSTTYYLADGFHRVAAVRRNGGDEIEAEVRNGDFTAALTFSLSANIGHGLRRTNEDKQKALIVAWNNREILFNGDPSSRQLAEITCVSKNCAWNFMKNSQAFEKDTPSNSASAPSIINTNKQHLEERNPTLRAKLKAGKDRFDVEIPPRLLPIFHSTLPKEMHRLLAQAKSRFIRAMNEGDFSLIDVRQKMVIDLHNAMNTLKFGTPYCVCRACRGNGCNYCDNRGFQTFHEFRLLPQEFLPEGMKK